MIQNPHITRHNLILQNRTGRNVNPIAVVRNDNHRAAKRNAPAERHVTADGQMVQINHVRHVREAGQKLANLAEMIVAQLDQRRGREHSLRRHHQRTGSQAVQIRHHQQQIGRLLDGQETRSRHIDADTTLEAFHRRTDGRFQLNHAQPVIERFVVDDRLHVERLVGQHTIDGCSGEL